MLTKAAKKYNKNSDIVKCYDNLKQLFSILDSIWIKCNLFL